MGIFLFSLFFCNSINSSLQKFHFNKFHRTKKSETTTTITNPIHFIKRICNSKFLFYSILETDTAELYSNLCNVGNWEREQSFEINCDNTVIFHYWVIVRYSFECNHVSHIILLLSFAMQKVDACLIEEEWTIRNNNGER